MKKIDKLIVIILFLITACLWVKSFRSDKQDTRITALEQEVGSVKETQNGIVTWSGEATREVNDNTRILKGHKGVFYQLTAPICYECHR